MVVVVLLELVVFGAVGSGSVLSPGRCWALGGLDKVSSQKSIVNSLAVNDT